MNDQTCVLHTDFPGVDSHYGQLRTTSAEFPLPWLPVFKRLQETRKQEC